MYCNLIIQILRYLSETFNFIITFIANLRDDLVNYIDSDYVRLINS